EVMYGAFAAAVALMHSGTGPAAAMSYPLGVHHGVPHGIAGAVFLPRVAATNVARGVHDYAELYDAPDGSDRDQPRHLKARGFVERVVRLWDMAGIPSS